MPQRKPNQPTVCHSRSGSTWSSRLFLRLSHHLCISSDILSQQWSWMRTLPKLQGEPSQAKVESSERRVVARPPWSSPSIRTEAELARPRASLESEGGVAWNGFVCLLHRWLGVEVAILHDGKMMAVSMAFGLFRATLRGEVRVTINQEREEKGV